MPSVPLRHCPGATLTAVTPPALDPRRDRHRVRRGLPRRHHRQRRAASSIGQELPATVVGVLEGQTYVVSGYLAVLAALLILAGALSDHYGRRRIYVDRPRRLRGDVGAVRAGARPSSGWSSSGSLQGAAGALLVPGSLALITQAFEGAARGRAFGIWAAVDVRR